MTAPYYTDPRVSLFHGDCLDILKELPGESVDAVVTDPPYGLEFMGKAWDTYRPGAFQAWCATWAKECLRIVKPGGHLVAFGGTRTSHRLTSGVEDAGFHIRDSIAWLYGSGFPKSRDIGKELPGWQGWGTALKPAHEPIVLARKAIPPGATVAGNVLRHGTGALNIDATRIGSTGGGNVCPGGDQCKCVTSGVTYSPTRHPVRREGEFGRWPANVVLDTAQAAELDRQSGESTSPDSVTRWVSKDPSNYSVNPQEYEVPSYGDTGGASRFYYTAKADGNERPRIPTGEGDTFLGVIRNRCTKCGRQKVNMPGSMCECAVPDFQPDPALTGYTTHPTVKPLSLMRWLTRLVTPPGGVVLDPFAGSGTTIEAAMLERFRCIAIEREAEYLPLCLLRIHRRRDPIAALTLQDADLGLFGPEDAA